MIAEYDIDFTVDEFYDHFNSSSDDYYMFIRPDFLDIDFNCCDKSQRLYSKVKSSQTRYVAASGGNFKTSKVNKKKSEVNSKKQCASVTNKGIRCSRAVQGNSDYCGIHSTGSKQCIAYTAKGDRCGRYVKSGSDYCGIHY
jgi:hypothetical protein